MTSYNTLITARATASALGLAKINAATDAALTAALVMAAIDIDNPGFRFQGQKYDPAGSITGTVQELEFPRVDGARVIDVDPDDQVTAMVPANVLLAECLQAEDILAGARRERLQAIADGIASQGVGSLSESYTSGQRPQPLCERAARIMGRYRMRGGMLL